MTIHCNALVDRLLFLITMALQTERTRVFELVLHLIADTDTDEVYFGMKFSVADADAAVLCGLEGGGKQLQMTSEIVFYIIADTELFLL